jgi:hypothetical protein
MYRVEGNHVNLKQRVRYSTSDACGHNSALMQNVRDSDARIIFDRRGIGMGTLCKACTTFDPAKK